MKEMSATQYDLSFDATESVRTVVGNLRCMNMMTYDDMSSEEVDEAQDAFCELLAGVGQNVSMLVFECDSVITPGAILATEPLDITHPYADHKRAEDLCAHGYLDGKVGGEIAVSIWFDGNSEHFGDNDRSVELYTVLRPFRVAFVTYGGYEPRGWGYSRATTCVVSSVIDIPAGDYLVGASGPAYSKHSIDVVSYLGPAGEADRESLFYALVEDEDWPDSHAYAGCDSCGARWDAESGSWHFEPSDAGYDGVPADLEAFDYDDMAFDADGKPQCPHCSSDDDSGTPTGAGRLYFQAS